MHALGRTIHEHLKYIASLFRFMLFISSTPAPLQVYNSAHRVIHIVMIWQNASHHYHFEHDHDVTCHSDTTWRQIVIFHFCYCRPRKRAARCRSIILAFLSLSFKDMDRWMDGMATTFLMFCGELLLRESRVSVCLLLFGYYTAILCDLCKSVYSFCVCMGRHRTVL